MKLSILFMSGSLLVAGVAGALAHGGATGIVKERMDAMSAMGDAMKALTAMMRGETGYDAGAVRSNAEVLQEHSGEALTKLFPEGSLQMASEARPEIWQNWQEFSDLSAQLEVFASALGNAAEKGLGAPMSGTSGAQGMTGMGTMMMGNGANMMGNGGMMGSGSMMGGQDHMKDPEMLAQMPVEGLFTMVAQTCSSCHTKFRAEKH